MKTLLEGIIEGFVREAPRKERQPGDTWQTDKGWAAKSMDTSIEKPMYGFKDEPSAKAWATGRGPAPDDASGEQPAGGEDDPQAGQQSVAQGAEDGAEDEEQPPREIPQGTLSDSDDELSDNGIKQTALDNGYVEGAPHTAPGNAGSMFHEIVTGEVSNWLFEDDSILKEPDPERALAERICKHFSTTTLGKEGSPKGVDIGQNWKLGAKSSTCRKAARASIKKYLFVKGGVDALVTEGKLTEPIKVRNYFGAKESIQKQKELIEQCSKVEGGGNFYTPSGVQVDRNDLLFFIEKSGGGENPADTATIAMDDNCNGVVSFHSDKMSPSDPQANSSINAEFEFFVKEMEKIRDVGLSDRQIKKARNIIIQGAKDVRKIELGLKRASLSAAAELITYDDEALEDLGARAASDTNKSGPSRYYKNLIGSEKVHPYFQEYCDNDCDTPLGRFKAFLRYSADEKEFCVDESGEALQFGGNKWINRDRDKFNDCKPKPTNPMAKLMERTAKIEYLKSRDELGPDHERTQNLNTGGQLGKIREETAAALQEIHNDLNKTRITYPPGDPNGREIGLGDYLEAKNVIEKFHLALLDDREREGGGRSLGAYDNLLNINMTDVLSTAKDIGACLGIENADDLISSFSVGPPEEGDEFIRDPDTKDVTGRKVFIYMVGAEGEKVKIGEKILRTKSGRQGKWETLYHWSKETQECLKDPPQPQQEESLSPREQQLRNELKKLVRDIAINRLGDYGN